MTFDEQRDFAEALRVALANGQPITLKESADGN